MELINLWRIRQFEYTWLRTVANAYVDFMRVTEDGLVYATKGDIQVLGVDTLSKEITLWPAKSSSVPGIPRVVR